ncbi:ubiquitin-activating enzyme e1 [Lasius niger]|uniref:Ubiquitin-activating enzyme e1 n=1 Tax=Lasius niger TaxID=67767 RepID=A0A0J7N178_LASNI|nr:ubiquitin-activating enzyme e1 [Lasius niger]
MCVMRMNEYGQHDIAFLSAHDLIYIKYGVRVERRLGRCVICRDWRNFDETALLANIRDLDWTSLLAFCCMDEKIEIFTSKLLDIFDTHAPLKRRHFKNLFAPWLTNDIRLVMHERNLARRTWRRRRNSRDYDRFKVLRIKAQSMIHTTKCDYYLNIFNNSDRANVVWSRLRHLGLIKARDFGASLLHSVDELNEFFAGGAMTPEANNHHLSFTELLSENYVDTNFHWNYVSPLTIRKVIAGASSNAVGTDGIAEIHQAHNAHHFTHAGALVQLLLDERSLSCYV